jgi:hypothetical protein
VVQQQVAVPPWARIGRGWLASLRSVPVRHCPDAWGAVLGLRLSRRRDCAGASDGDGGADEASACQCALCGGEGREAACPEASRATPARIVFSGDTMPCAELAAAGAGALLLVHEATFGDGEVEEDHARRKKHSTVAQALAVGDRMGAAHVLLTHFSQRYPLLPPPGVALAPSPPRVGSGGAPRARASAAFDLLTFRLRGAAVGGSDDSGAMTLARLPWLLEACTLALDDARTRAYVHQRAPSATEGAAADGVVAE